ncbi:MAG: DUF748 domain-containing protein [Deltaproteobacteria bacterium]|nr:DUF748 domain-containing protein [Deltaproteobacteria bacterium]
MKQALRRILTRKYFLIPMAVLCLYSLIGFFLAPWVIGWYEPKFVKEQLQCQLSVGKVLVNPFLLTLEMNDVSLDTPEEPLVEFKRLFIDFEIAHLWNGIETFRELRLENPTVHITVYPDGSTNIEKAGPKTPVAESSDSKPLHMMILNGLVSGGTIIVTDKRQSQPAIVTIQELDLNATNISTLPDQSGTYSISARTPDGEAFQCQGQIVLTPFASSGKLSFSAIQAETLWKFMKDSLDLESVTGKLDMTTDYRLEIGSKPPQLQLDDFHFGLLDLSLKLSRADKAFFELKNLDLDQVRFNLSEKQLQIGKLRVSSGAVNLASNEAGRINIAQIVRKDPKKETAQTQPVDPPLESTAAKAEPPAPPSLPWSANANSIEIKDIAFGLDDFSRATPIHVGVSGIGVGFAVKIQAGPKETEVLLENISSELKEVSIQRLDAAQPLFQTHKLTIEGGMLDLAAKTFTVSRVAMHGGAIDVSMDANGHINWYHLFAPKKAATSETVPATVNEPRPSWNYRIKAFEVDGFTSNLSDLGIIPDKPILDIQSFSCRLTDMDGRSPSDFEAGFSLKQGGTVAIRGKVDPAAPSVEANLNLKTLSLTPLQPYLKPIAALTLQSADVSLQGDIKYGLKAANAKISYTGSASLDRLQLTETNVKKTLIGCDSLKIPQIKLTLEPNRLDIDEIRLSKPTGEVIIAPDQTLNLSKVFKSQTSQTKTAAKPKPDSKKGQEAFPVRIGKVDIEKGDMIFADLSLQPQFMTRITNLKGEVSRLTSAGDSPSQVQLDGRVDQYGLAKISGKINIFHPELSTDISMVFKNVEMTKLTPYSGKFAGRRITSGKLFMDLKYRIQDQKLIGDNQIIVDNLTLGEHIDSPSAVNLPLDLAIALLRDSSGRIDIGLPVSGDLNDPLFSYGQLIGKALLNFLTKIVTSPFRALGSLFGAGAEQQDFVVFDPGKAELLPPEKEKLQKMADMLKNRPQLRLSIQGRYSPDADGAEIKAQSVRLAIAGLMGSKAGENEEFGALDFTAPNTRFALEKMFTEKTGAVAFDKLKQSIEQGAPNKADIPRVLAEALYTRLLESEPVPAENLSMLAGDRAREIVKELENAGGIPSERLVLKSPESQTSGPPSASFSLDVRTSSQ